LAQQNTLSGWLFLCVGAADFTSPGHTKYIKPFLGHKLPADQTFPGRKCGGTVLHTKAPHG